MAEVVTDLVPFVAAPLVEGIDPVEMTRFITIVSGHLKSGERFMSTKGDRIVRFSSRTQVDVVDIALAFTSKTRVLTDHSADLESTGS